MLLAAAAAALALAHPMGNFSVNHYARIEAAPGGLRIRYVLDLAEIPTFELFQQWGEGADPKKKVFEQAQAWAKGLDLRVDGHRRGRHPYLPAQGRCRGDLRHGAE